ncbi:MAG: hypothetical protein ABS76_23775 [Pelagibacterium sp. SCN 64-44]|nr:MAG: hypothetical protein ABS76_23775 [Pelagibacterium sp. SCN 64-44]
MTVPKPELEEEGGRLAKCSAIALARNEPDCEALMTLARKVGFGSVHGFTDPQQAGAVPSHNLLFFLVHFALPEDAKKRFLEQLRSAATINVCFAPVAVFLPDGPGDRVIEHIEMGFDDVICLPENSRVLAARLAAQVGRELLYIETHSYLGPDRRRMELPGQVHPARTGDTEHTRLTILRTPEHGVQILRRQVFFKGRR